MALYLPCVCRSNGLQQWMAAPKILFHCDRFTWRANLQNALPTNLSNIEFHFPFVDEHCACVRERCASALHMFADSRWQCALMPVASYNTHAHHSHANNNNNLVLEIEKLPNARKILWPLYSPSERQEQRATTVLWSFSFFSLHLPVGRAMPNEGKPNRTWTLKPVWASSKFLFL